MSDDDRTTPLGLFNYARSYWQSGVLLHDARAKVTHPNAPVTLLLAHAIELYLKAFLRLRGVGIDESKTALAIPTGFVDTVQTLVHPPLVRPGCPSR